MENLHLWPDELAKKYTELGYWRNDTLGDSLDKTAKAYPTHEAIVNEGCRLTYFEFARSVNRIALGLLQIGIKKGDRVIVQLPNWPEFMYTFYALAKIGAIGVLTLPQHRTREIGYLLKLTEAVAIVIPSHFKDFNYPEMVSQLRPECTPLKHTVVVGDDVPSGSISFSNMLGRAVEKEYSDDLLERAKPDANDVAFLLLTGGTTGFPKCVPRTHNDLLCIYASLSKMKNYDRNRVFLVNIPISHTVSLGKTICSVMTGGKVVLRTTSRPYDALSAIQTEKVTDIMFVTTQVQDLLALPDIAKYDLSSIRLIEIGGSYVPADVVRRLQARIKNGTVMDALGSAEGVHLTPRPEDPLEVRAETVGRPCCKVDEFKIVDDKGQSVFPGTEGELFVRGPHCVRAYYKAPEENSRCFDSEGFYHTGDVAMLDRDGNIRITNRKKDLIIRGGENISATEVEDAIRLYSKVDDVAVVAMPDVRLGEKVCAYIKPKKGENISFGELLNFLKAQDMTIFKLPERLEIVEQFPLTDIGKVNKKALKEDIVTKLKVEAKQSQSNMGDPSGRPLRWGN